MKVYTHNKTSKDLNSSLEERALKVGNLYMEGKQLIASMFINTLLCRVVTFFHHLFAIKSADKT